MLAKIWKKLFLIICIIAIIIDIGHKLVSRTSLKEQLIELATTESLSTSIKYFVREKFGDLKDEDTKEFSNPVGEFVDVFKNDKSSSNDDSQNTTNRNNIDFDDENKIKDIDAETINAPGDNDINAEANDENTSNKSDGNKFTRIIQNMVDDMNDNAYLNDDPSDDLIYSGEPTF